MKTFVFPSVPLVGKSGRTAVVFLVLIKELNGTAVLKKEAALLKIPLLAVSLCCLYLLLLKEYPQNRSSL